MLMLLLLQGQSLTIGEIMLFIERVKAASCGAVTFTSMCETCLAPQQTAFTKLWYKFCRSVCQVTGLHARVPQALA